MPHILITTPTPHKRGEYFSFDLSGAASTPGFNGEKYRGYIIDRKTGYAYIRLFESKRAEPIENFLRKCIAHAERTTGNTVKAVKMDNASEFERFGRYCEEKGIEFRHSPPYSHASNGRAEVQMRISKSIMDAIMVESGIPTKLWNFAARFAHQAAMNTPTANADTKETFVTPLEKFTERKQPLTHFRKPFCQATVHIPVEQRIKQDLHGQQAMFVGYAENSKAYEFLSAGKIIISRDAKFHEHKMCYPPQKKYKPSDLFEKPFETETAGEGMEEMEPTYAKQESTEQESAENRNTAGEYEDHYEDEENLDNEPESQPSMEQNLPIAEPEAIPIPEEIPQIENEIPVPIPQVISEIRPKIIISKKPARPAPDHHLGRPTRASTLRNAKINAERISMANAIIESSNFQHDTPKNYRQVINGTSGDEWLNAYNKEVYGLADQNCWEMIEKADMKNDQIVNFLIQFKRKHDGSAKC
jgi:hypothetical protein